MFNELDMTLHFYHHHSPFGEEEDERELVSLNYDVVELMKTNLHRTRKQQAERERTGLSVYSL